jgi:hypothetical protein
MRAVVLAVAAGLCVAGCTPEGAPAQPRASASASSGASIVTVPADYVAVAAVRDAASPPYNPALAPTDTHASYVVGPRYHVGIDAVAITPRFTANSKLYLVAKRPEAGPGPSQSGPSQSEPGGPARPLTLQAPPGHELVVAHLFDVPGKTINGDTGFGAGDPTDPKLLDLSVRMGQDPPVRLGSHLSNGSLVLVSVPVGADPRLVVDDHSGHPQSLNLRTGGRADALALLYPSRTMDLPTPVTARLAYTAGGEQGTLDLTMKVWVNLVPWEAGRGWARPGGAWLLVGLALDVPSVGMYGTLTLDAARTFTLRGAGGGTLRALPDTVALTQSRGARVMFDVPDSFRTGTLGIALAGTVAVDNDPPQPIRVSAAQHTSAQITLPA